MKRTWLIFTLFASACSGPLAPDTTLPTYTPIRPTLTVYVCQTQPRVYCTPALVCQVEVDTYQQNEPCPVTPIP